jgi:transglutaminase-like putative cysteine protease
MKLSVDHQTIYDYQPAVETAQHLAYLTPRHNAHQQRLSHRIDVTPVPALLEQTEDVWGNLRSFFYLQEPHRQLVVHSHSVVLTAEGALPESQLSWEAARERFRYRAGLLFDAANEFVFASPMVPRHAAFADYARPSFASGVPLREAALDMMHRIHADFSYETQSTEVNTPALVALQQRKGVCQDFAHILIACLRAMGLPARYVSGYLLTLPPPGQVKLRGSDASHAWAAVYLPDAAPAQRWLHLDPTNDRAGSPSPGADYVVLADGRDFSDVSPMRGVIVGGAHHVLTVGVTVEPADPPVERRSSAASPMQGQSQSQSQGSGQSQGQSQGNEAS